MILLTMPSIVTVQPKGCVVRKRMTCSVNCLFNTQRISYLKWMYLAIEVKIQSFETKLAKFKDFKNEER